MIQMDAAFAGVIVTVLLGLMALAYGYGSLNKEVKNIRKDSDKQDDAHKETIAQIRAEFKAYQINNREDHSMIFQKLDKILQNGARGG